MIWWRGDDNKYELKKKKKNININNNNGSSCLSSTTAGPLFAVIKFVVSSTKLIVDAI